MAAGDAGDAGDAGGSVAAAAESLTARAISARLERIDVWSLSFLFIGIIGLGFVFTFYDIFDINVSFIQTCVDLKKGCTPPDALSTIRVPIALNLAGYVVGALALAPIADRVGRRQMLMVTMGLTGLASLYTALAPDYPNFVFARALTGIGIGADLAIVNTYINEVAPRAARAKYTSVIFFMAAVGAFLGIWLGLILTTMSEPWPKGLSFAVGGHSFFAPHGTGIVGWRLMYGIGALLALVAVVLRVGLPESPRWLVARGRLAEADEVVRGMETRAARHGPLAEPSIEAVEPLEPQTAQPYRDLLASRRYRRRVIVLLVTWAFAYVTVYAFGAGFTSLFAALKYAPPTAGLITAVGVSGFVVAGICAVLFAERLERRYWLPVCAALTLGGGILAGLSGSSIALAMIGAGIVFFAFNLWVPMTYAWSAESFPTRARSTGFALVDGLGHAAGGIGILLIAPAIPDLGPLPSFILIAAFLVVAAIVAQFGEHTRARRLDEISP